MQQQIIRETFHLVSKRDDNVCNFLEGGRQVLLLGDDDDTCTSEKTARCVNPVQLLWLFSIWFDVTTEADITLQQRQTEV